MADTQSKRPPAWKMVQDAIHALGGQVKNVQIKNWVLARYPNAKASTINWQIGTVTVNRKSRVNAPENSKPRVAKDARYDFLFTPSYGMVELYDPSKHGIWEIFQNEDGSRGVRRIDSYPQEAPPAEEAQTPSGAAFAAEAHLQDYLVQHLGDVEPGLTLFTDDDGVSGVEYSTPIGRIDILAEDEDGGLVVLELKVGQSPDKAAGQILRYKNWVHLNMASGQRTRGIIIARHISDKLKYAIASDPDISAREYEISMTLTKVPGVGSNA
jgi:endonuclease NucS-like protein